MHKPNTLQGLNVIHPPQPQSDQSDLLAGGSAFPDLSEQLELWTNLAFDQEESHSDEGRFRAPTKFSFDEEEEEDAPQLHHPAQPEAHVNAVTGKSVPQLQSQQQQPDPAQFDFLTSFLQNADGQQQQQHSQAQASTPDLMALLASMGADPFGQRMPSGPVRLQPSQQQLPVPQQPPYHLSPSIAQLLAQANFTASTPQAPPAGAGSPFSSLNPAPPTQDKVPAAKRTRSRKSSVASTLVAEEQEDEEGELKSSPSSSTSSTTAPSLAGDDKRKRNTAASARFRQKKKEREAALEQKAKELEVKVSELERECEGLRRENGWLKGLVIGVTGAAHSQSPAPATSAGVKRSLEDTE